MRLLQLELADLDVNMFSAVDNSLINDGCKKDVMEKMRAYCEVIHENIDYQYHAKEDVDELVEL